MKRKRIKIKSKKLHLSDKIWNQIDEFYKLKTQDERLEFILKTKNKYYGK